MISAGINPIERMLSEQGFVVLDGGFATELEARGLKLDELLWSAGALIDHPEIVRQVHLAYLAAGADCIISASYQATLAGFEARGLPRLEAMAMLQRSVELASEAREIFWRNVANRRGRLRPLIAASVGPYGAYLADGSEFRGDYDLTLDGLIDFHLHRWQILAASDADLLACETIPSASEARALGRLLAETPGRLAWMSFSCCDEAHLCDGTPLADTVAELEEMPQIVAFGVNCTAPQYISRLIGAIRAVTEKSIVVYPNSGESWDATAKRWLPVGAGPFRFGAASKSWFRLGARLIGGCCRTGPADIRAIRQALEE